MTRPFLSLAAFSLVAALAACGENPDKASTPAASRPGRASETTTAKPDSLDTAAGATRATSAGTVTAVDAAAGTITIDHQPIPEAGWPAMTMAFKAGPEVLSQVQPGDNIAFVLELQGAAGEVIHVEKRRR